MDHHHLLNKQVQEIAADCHHLPERYIRKQDEQHRNVAAEVPVIDFSLLASSSSSELKKLKSAVISWGCFQAINHGIEGSFLEKVREIGRLFFRLPMDEKKKYLRAKDDVEGYGNDMVLSEQQTLDWTDRIYLTVFPKHQQKLQFWPQSPTHFRDVLDEYTSKIDFINNVVLKALATSLNLNENCFVNQYGTSATMYARFNYYPPCQWPEKTLGLKPHADGSAITVLLQDNEVEGLQILKDDKWFGVPIVRDALTINIGDQMEIMSNGIFKSPMHKATVNSKKERMSLAVFCMPQTGKDIGPVDELITNVTPRLYKNVTFSLNFYFQNYQHNKRYIDACKI